MFPLVAHAGTLRVNCDSNRGLNQIQKAINLLQQQETAVPSTILVSGSCKENITIQSLDNLTLTAQNGASITDASNGALDVIDIFDSRRVLIQGFTVNRGANGSVCGGQSLCRFSGNVIQNSAGSGVFVTNGSQVGFAGDTLQNHAARGLSVVGGAHASLSSVTVQGNGDGIVLVTGGTWNRVGYGRHGDPVGLHGSE